MREPKSQFAIPRGLLEEFDRELDRSGFYKNRAACAAILHFLEMPPEEQIACLKRLEERFPAPPRRCTSHQRIVRPRKLVTDKLMRLQIPPPDQQRIIGGKPLDH